MHEHKLCNEQIRSYSVSTASNQQSFWGFSMAASSSTAATLSWSSSSFFQSFGNTVNESVKLPDKRSVLLVLAQRKAKKTRKVINLFIFLKWVLTFSNFHSLNPCFLFGSWENFRKRMDKKTQIQVFIFLVQLFL